MAYEEIADGLTITIPTTAQNNWGPTMKTLTWKKISSHNHTGSGNGVQLSANALSSNAVTTAKIADEAVTNAKLSDDLRNQADTSLTPAGTTEDIDFAAGKVQKLSLGSASGNVIVTLENMVNGAEYTIVIIQGATPRVVTWVEFNGAAIRWEGGSEPTGSHSANTKHIIKLLKFGSEVFGWYFAGMA